MHYKLSSMRRFSDSEKVTIRSLVTHYSLNPMQYILVNAYNDIFYKYKVKFDASQNGYLIFYRHSNDINIYDIGEVTNSIIETSLLIKYLVNNDLIILIDTNSVNQLREIGGSHKDESDIEVRIQLDKGIAEILLSSMNHRIFVSETLKFLVEDDFVTSEDKILESNRILTKQTIELTNSTNQQNKELRKQTEHTFELARQAEEQTSAARQQAEEAKEQTMIARKQTKVSIIALILSIISIICSYIFTHFVTMEVRIVEEQYNSLQSKFEEIKANTDSISKALTDSVIIKNKQLDVTVMSVMGKINAQDSQLPNK